MYWYLALGIVIGFVLSLPFRTKIVYSPVRPSDVVEVDEGGDSVKEI